MNTPEERREQVMRMIRSTPLVHAKNSNDCQIMGCRLSEFTHEEQIELCLWQIETLQRQIANLTKNWK